MEGNPPPKCVTMSNNVLIFAPDVKRLCVNLGILSGNVLIYCLPENTRFKELHFTEKSFLHF